jgi:pimeloyl-ACP methyl ester carboxylesterase
LALATVALADTSPFRADVSGSGPPMLLIPGLNSSGAVWDGVIDHFKSRYTCHALTLAGFAGQPPLAAPALSTVRDAILTSVRARAEMMRRAMENESAEQRERSSALSLASMVSDRAHIAMAQRWATSSDARTTALDDPVFLFATIDEFLGR